MIDFSALRNIHFIGIGGISLSSLAMLSLQNGVTVSGSDKVYSEIICKLQDNGCRVWVGENPEYIPINTDLCVFSSAVANTNSELLYCKAKNIQCMERFVFLGVVSKNFDSVIGIAGTHGKTTVTAMLIEIYRKANRPFCGHLGGELPDIGNYYYSGNNCFITEACEYRKSLLSLNPKLSVVLNVESDHPDTYRGLSEIYDTFDSFLDNTQNGLKIINGDSAYYHLRQSHDKNVITFGYDKSNTYKIENIIEYENGYYQFEIYKNAELLSKIKLSIPGKHNVINACAAFAVADSTLINVSTTISALEDFTGVKRRFQTIGLFCGAKVIIDYAHHPDEISAVTSTARRILDNVGKLIVVFQPHTYSRTALLLDKFVVALSDCDHIVICKEYAAREKPSDGLSAADLFMKLTNQNKQYCENILEIYSTLEQIVMPKDIILILGAGDIDTLAKLLVGGLME